MPCRVLWHELDFKRAMLIDVSRGALGKILSSRPSASFCLLSFLWLHYAPHVCCPSSLPALFNAQTTAVGESLILTRRNIVSHALHELKGWVKASATPLSMDFDNRALYPLPMET